MQMDRRTRTLMAEALESLERCGCQFDFCPGPDKRPVHMMTCHACETIRRLRRALGIQGGKVEPHDAERKRAGVNRDYWPDADPLTRTSRGDTPYRRPPMP